MKEIGEKQNEVNAVLSKVHSGKRTYQAQQWTSWSISNESTTDKRI